MMFAAKPAGISFALAHGSLSLNRLGCIRQA